MSTISTIKKPNQLNQKALDRLNIYVDDNLNPKEQTNIKAKTLPPVITFLIVAVGRNLMNGIVILMGFIFIYLGKSSMDQIGNFYFISGLVTILTLVTTFGSIEGIQKFVATKNGNKIILPNFILQSIIAGFVIIILHIAGVLADQSIPTKLLTYTTIALSAFNSTIMIYNGLGKQIKSASYQIIYSGLFLLIGIITHLSLNTSAVDSFLLGMSISQSLITANIFLSLYRDSLLTRDINPLKLPKDFIKFCLDNLVYTACFLIVTQSDVLFLKGAYSSDIIGIYKPITQIGMLIRIGVLALVTFLFPRVVMAYESKNKKQIMQYFKLFFGGFNALLMAFLIAIIAVRVPVASYLSQGNDDLFEIAKNSLPLVFVGFGLQSLCAILVNFLQAVNRSQIVRNFSIFEAIIHLLACFVVVGFSVYAVGIVFVITQSIALAYYCLQFWKYAKN